MNSSFGPLHPRPALSTLLSWFIYSPLTTAPSRSRLRLSRGSERSRARQQAVLLHLVMATGAIQSGRRFRFPRQGQQRSPNTGGWQVGVLAVAVETPAHGKRPVLPHAIHVLNRPMALLAGHAGNDMLAVIEIHKVR